MNKLTKGIFKFSLVICNVTEVSFPHNACTCTTMQLVALCDRQQRNVPFFYTFPTLQTQELLVGSQWGSTEKFNLATDLVTFVV